MRSGSTWLELLLKEVPGVYSDFEVKWAPNMQNYEKIRHDLHIYLTGPHMNVSDELSKRMPEGDIVGSKLVLDHFDYSDESLAALKKTIPKDMKIIFLWRHPTDIILSIKRGVSNKLGNHAGNTKMESELKKMQHIFNDRDYDADFFFFDRRDFLKDILLFSRQHCWCRSLAAHVDDFMEVDYNEVNKRFTEIVRFIGSDAPVAVLDAIKNNPITVKTGPKEEDRAEYIQKHTNLGRTAYLFHGRDRLNYQLLIIAMGLYGFYRKYLRSGKGVQNYGATGG